MIFSCSSNKTTVLQLNTDIPEVLPLIEQFNKESDYIKININSTMQQGSPDLIIYRGLANNSPYELRDISNLFSNKINKNNFYIDILKQSVDENSTVTILPLAFDIPGLMYNKNRFKHKRVIRVEDFIKDETIRFSPYWDMEFVMWYYRSNVPKFEKDKRYLDLPVYIATAQDMRNLILNNKDKWDDELFNKKYMHLSPELLIQSNTIEYFYINFSDYVNLNSNFRKDISFSFLSKNELVIADESIIYTGITKSSKNLDAAEEFLSWIFNVKNQNSYISNNIKDGGLESLFLGQLSTLTKVSEELLPFHYPRIAPYIPKNQMITIPDNLPPLWESLKKQVFIPGLRDSKTSSDQVLESNFNTLFKEWYKKHKK